MPHNLEGAGRTVYPQRATEYQVRNNSPTELDAGDRQNLGSRYGEIGISAVTAALMCIRGVRHRDQIPETRSGRGEKQPQHRRKGPRSERSTKSVD